MAQQVSLLPVTLLSQVFFATFFGFWVVTGAALTVVAQVWLQGGDQRCSGSMAQPQSSGADLEEAATKSGYLQSLPGQDKKATQQTTPAPDSSSTGG